MFDGDIRIFATGRKSWLFSDTVDGAKASAVTYSLMLTCRAYGVEPFAWLRHVLTELPQRSNDTDIDDLLPFKFKKTDLLTRTSSSRFATCTEMSTAEQKTGHAAAQKSATSART